MLTPELVAEVFGVRSHRWVDPDTGQVHLGFSRLAETTTNDDAVASAAGPGQERG
ncbi:hypothetical protein [Saccharothrix coeruleofusca]|uniref:Uncharacterized protein n=1 Tax=Saccharothrix coeruleofusca TaxID=33919 RepID=A0A918EGJ8_9PSEU|nr:hypothetical protein [Saccharothrix coeruleofusca]MBP2334838.1 hypothetical protein [Saccharothrix coeruleofusca]GGP73838.1 hypothetical protein GCM10010185_54090 [Saccharothrix coeruleofusca]